MPTTDESILIPAPPEEVFDYLDDPAHLPVFDPTILSAELDGDGPVRLGSRIKAESRILGRNFGWVVEVTEHDRPTKYHDHPTKYTVSTVEGQIGFTASYTLSPEAGGTRLDYHLDAAGGLGGVFGTVPDASVSKRGSRQMRANLATLSEIITEHGKSEVPSV